MPKVPNVCYRSVAYLSAFHEDISARFSGIIKIDFGALIFHAPDGKARFFRDASMGNKSLPKY
jgi:hypothetical protein